MVKTVNAFKSVGTAVHDVYSGFSSLISKISGSQGTVDAQAGETQALADAEQEQAAAAQEAADAQGELDVAMDASGIGEFMIAIVALGVVIALVVTHWKDFERWGEEAFHVVEHGAEDAFNWVKGHWPLLLAILLGPIALAAYEIVTHWHDIEHGAEEAFDDVEHYAEVAFNWVKGHWPLLLAILTGPIGLATLFIVDHWHQISDGAADAIHDVESWFGRLPGMILSWVSGFGHLLWSAGQDLLHGLIGGIESIVGDVIHTVENVGSSVLHGIEGALGIGSPSKEMYARGAFAVQGLVLGMTDGIPLVIGASHQLAAATLAGYSGGAVRPAAGAAGAAGSSGNIIIHQHFDKMIAGNANEIAKETVTMLRSYKRRNGGVALGIG
jgi:hypothetical protein